MVARADRSVSDTRAAPTAAAPGRAGAPTTAVAPVVWRSPVPVTVVFGAVGGTTVARPVAGVDVVVPGLGEAVVVRPVDVALGLVLSGGSGGTATTGTDAEVRTVGSWSAIRPPSPAPLAVAVPELPEAEAAEPDPAAALPASDEMGATTGVGGGVVAVARGV
jgi:hypothetical protein